MLRLIYFFIATSLCLSFALANSYNLPQIGNASAGVISTADESIMGLQYFQQLKQELPLLQDPFIVQYIQQLGKTLVSHSNAPKQHFYFFVVNSPAVNAFAGPDGYVAVNSGLILTAQSEGEVAAVLAHEIAHVTQRHIARSIAEAKQLQIANIAGMLAGIAVGMNNPQAGAGIASAAAAGSIQKSLSYSRGYEEEADRFGMQTLARSGYNPQYMPSFFERLEQLSRANGGEDQLFALLMTHPVTSARIADAENRLTEIRVVHQRPNNPYFYLIQARTLVVSANDPSGLSDTLAGKLSLQSNNVAIRYAYALSLLKSSQLNKAATQIQMLLSKDPNNILFLVAKASLQLAQNKVPECLNTLSQLQKNNPNNLAVLQQYTQVLLRVQQYEKAYLVLAANKSRYDNNEAFLTLLAQAQGHSGKLAEAYETRAKILQLNNDYDGAILQLQQAKKFSKDPYQQSRINFELTTLQRLQQQSKALN